MFSQKSLDEIEKIVKFLGNPPIVPFKFNKARSEIVFNDSITRIRFTKAVIAHYVIHSVFISIQLICALREWNLKPGQLYFLVVMWTNYPFGWEIYSSLIQRRYQLVKFFREIVSTFHSFESKIFQK